MSKINWIEVAKQNNMTFDEFGSELIASTMAFMEAEIRKNNSDEMIVTSYPISLTCKILNKDKSG